MDGYTPESDPDSPNSPQSSSRKRHRYSLPLNSSFSLSTSSSVYSTQLIHELQKVKSSESQLKVNVERAESDRASVVKELFDVRHSYEALLSDFDLLTLALERANESRTKEIQENKRKENQIRKLKEKINQLTSELVDYHSLEASLIAQKLAQDRRTEEEIAKFLDEQRALEFQVEQWRKSAELMDEECERELKNMRKELNDGMKVMAIDHERERGILKKQVEEAESQQNEQRERIKLLKEQKTAVEERMNRLDVSLSSLIDRVSGLSELECMICNETMRKFHCGHFLCVECMNICTNKQKHKGNKEKTEEAKKAAELESDKSWILLDDPVECVGCTNLQWLSKSVENVPNISKQELIRELEKVRSGEDPESDSDSPTPS
jgi:chromosome segregation ATPase